MTADWEDRAKTLILIAQCPKTGMGSGDSTADSPVILSLSRWYETVGGERILKFWFYSIIFLAVAFMLVTSLSFSFEDRLFATVVGIPTAALTLIQLAFVVRPSLRDRFDSGSAASDLQKKFAESIEGRAEQGHSAAKRREYEIKLIVWISGLVVAVYVAGMTAVIPVWVFGFIWYFKGDLRAAAGSTALFVVLSYLIFIVFLDLRPWPGIWLG
jgi:hypothetical protein